MSTLRTKGLSTKLTDDEYATLERAAAGQMLSIWARDALLRAASPAPTEAILLAEVLALRTILLNLHFAVANAEAITPALMHQLVSLADDGKLDRARQRLAEAVQAAAR